MVPSHAAQSIHATRATIPWLAMSVWGLFQNNYRFFSIFLQVIKKQPDEFEYFGWYKIHVSLCSALAVGPPSISACRDRHEASEGAALEQRLRAHYLSISRLRACWSVGCMSISNILHWTFYSAQISIGLCATRTRLEETSPHKKVTPPAHNNK